MVPISFDNRLMSPGRSSPKTVASLRSCLRMNSLEFFFELYQGNNQYNNLSYFAPRRARRGYFIPQLGLEVAGLQHRTASSAYVPRRLE